MAGAAVKEKGEGADSAEADRPLTDGFHLVIDALKLNGIDTIYGVPGIPITDLGRMAQAAGIRVISFRHEQNAGNAAAITGFLTKKPGICLTVSAPGFLNGSDGAGQRHDQLLSDDPDQRLVGARNRRPAARRLRRDGPTGHRQTALQGGLSRVACRRHRYRRGAGDSRRRFRPSGRRLSRPAGQAFRASDGRGCRRQIARQSYRPGAGADPRAERQSRARSMFSRALSVP